MPESPPPLLVVVVGVGTETVGVPDGWIGSGANGFCARASAGEEPSANMTRIAQHQPRRPSGARFGSRGQSRTSTARIYRRGVVPDP